MQPGKWIAITSAALATLWPSRTVQASPTPTPVATESWANVTVNHAAWQRVPILRNGKDNYFGVWYLTKLLRERGMQPAWTGKSLSAKWLPQYVAASKTTIGAKTIVGGDTMVLNGSVYANLSAIANTMGWQFRYNSQRQTITLGEQNTFAKSPNKTSGRDQSGIHSVKSSAQKTVHATKSWASIIGWKNVPVLRVSGTSFVGMWYLMHWLSDYGYQADWQNGKLEIADLPKVIQNGTVVMGDNVDTTMMIQYQNQWYVPLSTVMYSANFSAGVDNNGNVHLMDLDNFQSPKPGAAALHGSFTVSALLQQSAGNLSDGLSQAKVAVLQGDGSVVTTSAAPSTKPGTIALGVNGNSGTVIGVYTPSVGWVGKADAIDSNTSSLNVSLTQEMSHIQGSVIAHDSTQHVGNSVVELRSDLTHAHYFVNADSSGKFTGTIPVGPYEVWTITVNGKPLFLGQRFLAKAGSTTVEPVKIPALPTTSTYVTEHFVVTAQAMDVSPLQLVSVGNMLERVYSYDVTNTGLTPELPIRVQVYETVKEYTQHFLDQAYPADDAGNYGEYSQAVSEGPQDVSVDLDGLTHEFGVDVTAHEFLHSLIDTVSVNIPTWMNEGIAWHQGIGAELDISPSDLLASALKWTTWEEIVNHQKIGDLYPLDSSNTLAPRYNVEAQDYFAVEMLMQQYGLQKVIDCVKQVDQFGDKRAFQQAFGKSEPDFYSEVTKQLQQDAAGIDHGFTATLRIEPNGPSKLFVSNPGGKTYWFDGAEPGQTYTFTCHANGTVTTSSSLTGHAPISSSGDGTWDVGAEQGTEQGFFSIDNAFGLGYLQSASMFYNQSNNADEQIATELPIGVQLVSITPNS